MSPSSPALTGRAHPAVLYYRTATGTFVTPGDTKAEENGWNAQILRVATAMMPDHPNYATWMRKSIELAIFADAFGFDDLASQKDAYREGYHEQRVPDMQNRFTDGHTYAGTYHDAKSEDTSPDREEWVATTPAGPTSPAGSSTGAPSP